MAVYLAMDACGCYRPIVTFAAILALAVAYMHSTAVLQLQKKEQPLPDQIIPLIFQVLHMRTDSFCFWMLQDPVAKAHNKPAAKTLHFL
jgi:putative Ca2+/H+ antiporter (TMEM165/GDT1 family)